jgi:hypothetical protein
MSWVPSVRFQPLDAVPRLNLIKKRFAAIRKLRKQGVGINKTTSKLGIGVSVAQRIVSAQG